MADQMSLEGILNDEKPAPVEKVEKELEIPVLGEKPAGEVVKDPVEKQQTERNQSRRQVMRDKEQAAQGRVRDPETGQYVKKEADAEPAKETLKEPAKEVAKEEPAKPDIAAPQQEFTEKEKAFLRGMQEERKKRQELERQNAELLSKLPQEPAKTFWDDPEAALAKHTAEVRQEATNARLAMAEFNARQRHPDFQEKVDVFSQLTQQNPGLVRPWLASPDPAEYAYRVGKNHKELQEAGGIEELRAKIERETEARVRTKIEVELKEKADALAKDRAALPGSLSDARAVGGGHRPVWNGPTTLDSILGKG